MGLRKDGRNASSSSAPSLIRKKTKRIISLRSSIFDRQPKKKNTNTHTHNIKKTHLPYDFSPSAFFSLDCFFSLPVQFFFFHHRLISHFYFFFVCFAPTPNPPDPFFPASYSPLPKERSLQGGDSERARYERGSLNKEHIFHTHNHKTFFYNGLPLFQSKIISPPFRHVTN